MNGVINQTQGTVFHQNIQATRSGLKNKANLSMTSIFLTDFEMFGYPDETVFRTFDIASQTDH